MQYSFVNTEGNIVDTRVFIERPDNPHYSKGVWLLDEPPEYNPEIENLEVVYPISLVADSIPYLVTDKDIEVIRLAKIKEMYRDYLVAQQLPVYYMGSTFQADLASQDVLAKSLAGMNVVAPAGFYWVDAQNNKVAMSFENLQGMAAAMFQQGWDAFKNLQNKKDLASSPDATVATIKNITWA
jgi:hypothetical protein